MKIFRVFLFTICLFIGNNLFAQLTISHLTGDFYIFTTWKNFDGTPFPANGMYMVTSEGVVIFDTPWDTKQVFPLLDSIEQRHHKKVVLCLATHYHGDRTGGFDLLKSRGVKTYSSKLTLDFCRIKNEKTAEYYFVKDTVFTIGNHSFETFYPGKGHTTDNIVVWFADKKILYGGCFVKSTDSPTLGNVEDADIQEWETSVNKVMAKYPSPAYIIPGHFGWKSKKSLKYTLKLVKAAKMGK